LATAGRPANRRAGSPEGLRYKERSLAEYGPDGRFELYKTSAEHEGEAGRKQHGFPSQEEMAG
jgi:hypothetical protein